MQNSILTDISKIDAGLKTLHSEGVSLRVARQQHEEEIKKMNAGVEAEYAATIASLAGADQIIESNYQQQMVNGTDAENQADSNYKSTVSQASNAIRAKYDTIIRHDQEYIADLEAKCRIAANNNEKILQKYYFFELCIMF